MSRTTLQLHETPSTNHSGDETAFWVRPESRKALLPLLREVAMRFPDLAEASRDALDLLGMPEQDRDAAYAPLAPDRVVAMFNALMTAEDESRNADEGLHERLVAALRDCGYRLIESSYRRFWLPLDVWVVAVNETEHWQFGDKGEEAEYRQWIDRIESVYYGDFNRKVHLCSMTPSAEMYYYETRAILKDGAEEAKGEGFCERLRDFVREEGHRCSQGVEYWEFADLERRIERGLTEPGTVHHYGNPGLSWDEIEGDDEERQYMTIMDDVLRESFNQNAPL